MTERSAVEYTFPISPKNCAFGSASPCYWSHGNFAKAWRDGQKGEFRGKNYVIIGRGDCEYLHVPCHAEDTGECRICDELWGAGTTHRLWPKWWPKHMYVGPKHEKPPHTITIRRRREVVKYVRVERNERAKHGWAWIVGIANSRASSRGGVSEKMGARTAESKAPARRS